MKKLLIAKWSIKRRIVASVLVLLLIAFSILHFPYSLTFVAGDDIACLINNVSGELIEPAFSFQANGQTTRLYFFDGYIIWTSSFVSYSEAPIIAKQRDPEVTVYGYGYISVEGDSYPSKTPDIHMHDHSDSEVAVVIPDPSINLRRKLAS